MIHAFLLAILRNETDTYIYFDFARVFTAIKITSSDQADIRLYSNLEEKEKRAFQFQHEEIVQSTPHIKDDLEIPDTRLIRNPDNFLNDVTSIEGLNEDDRVIIYLADQKRHFSSEDLHKVLLHPIQREVPVLLFVSSYNSMDLIKAFALTYLNPTDMSKKKVTIILADNQTNSSYNIYTSSLGYCIGTEFCQILLALLSKLKDPNISIRSFRMDFPEKFIVVFGSNADDPLSEYFGSNIANYSTAFEDALSCGIKYIAGACSVPPRLYRLLEVLLGTTPTNEILDQDLNDEQFMEYRSHLSQVSSLLIEKEIVHVSRNPIGNAINCFAIMDLDTIKKGVEKVIEETSRLSSNIK